jgi:hypothetical protein
MQLILAMYRALSLPLPFVKFLCAVPEEMTRNAPPFVVQH